MKTYLIESREVNPWHNLAVERVLSERVGPGDVILYLWQNDHTVVIGKGQNALRECRGPLLEEEGGYLARRTTGGGAVYHDMGNLCFTFLASPACYDLQRQMHVVMEAVASFGIKTQLSGRNDLITEEGRKFSGNAFSILKNCKIQHGTLMVNVDRNMLSRYLTPSPLKLSAKGIASVRSRVVNLSQLCPDITTDQLKKELIKAFIRTYSGEEAPRLLTEDDLDEEALRRYEALNASWEWRYGRSPECDVEYEHLFAWGEVQIRLKLKNMVISECRVYSDCLDTEYPGRMEQVLSGMRFSPDDCMEQEKRIRKTYEEGPLRQLLTDTLLWLAGQV